MAGRGLGPSSLRHTIRINSVRKGLLGGSRFWLAMFVAGYLARWSSNVTKRGPMPLRFSEELRPGEALVIRHIDTSRRSS